MANVARLIMSVAPPLIGAADVWTVKADWNALGTHGTVHDNVPDLAQCLSKASGHLLFSYAKDSSHCYVSDGAKWGGGSAAHVTSGCISGKVASCPAAGTWTVIRDWNSLGTHGTKTKVADMEACLAKAKHHAQFSYAQDSSNCYVSDSTTFGGSTDSHVTSGCSGKVKGCGAAPHKHHPHAHHPHAHHPAPHVHHPAPHKHHPHHPEPMCAGWPTFASAAALAASPWGSYFEELYGSSPPAHYFPLDVGSWWILWDDLLTKHKVPLPKSAGTCAPANCQLSLFRENNAYSPPKTQWIWHPPPYHPTDYAPPGGGNPWTGWIEVMHKKDPFGDEHYGAWFLYAKGSGVWYNTGKFIEFDEHSDAYSHFGQHGNEAMCRAAAAAGYDTVIFLAHKDHVNYPCDTAGKYPYMNVEIVAVKLQGTFSCGMKGKDPGALRSGWEGKDKCNCNDQFEESNCGRLIRSQLPEATTRLEVEHSSLIDSHPRGEEPMNSGSGAPVSREGGVALESSTTVSVHAIHAQESAKIAFRLGEAPPGDCSQNHSSATDPPWFATCRTEGACLRMTIKSRTLSKLNLGNTTRGPTFGHGFHWCIDHLNQVIYAKLNATHQSMQAPYYASFFEVDYPKRPGRQANQTASCRFLATHWASGDVVQIFQQDMLNCTSAYVPSQLPGPDGVTNAVISVA